jgi:UDP-3-O-acyl-N-acetylglucosamine deacetylase
MPQEPGRHKVLDLLGDLWLLGRPLRARIIARRPNHRLNIALARRLEVT